MQTDSGCVALKKRVRQKCWARCNTEAELIARYEGMSAKDPKEQGFIDKELAGKVKVVPKPV